MTTIKKQIDEIIEMFNCDREIVKIEENVLLKDSLTLTEMEDIAYILKTAKDDGVYEINDFLEVCLYSGICVIADRKEAIYA